MSGEEEVQQQQQQQQTHYSPTSGVWRGLDVHRHYPYLCGRKVEGLFSIRPRTAREKVMMKDKEEAELNFHVKKLSRNLG